MEKRNQLKSMKKLSLTYDEVQMVKKYMDKIDDLEKELIRTRGYLFGLEEISRKRWRNARWKKISPQP